MSAADTPPVPLEAALDAEYALLHPGQGTSDSQPRDLDEALRRHGQAGHAALCLSGGGVRSGSFGLGVLQGLARAGILDGFDYLSTVSGGGYIGGWLTAWRLRADARKDPTPFVQLSREAEPESLTRLRRLIKFLDPRSGALSTDVWTLGGTMFRNLLVNWMVLLPLIAAAAMVPRLYLGVLGLPSQPELVSPATLEWWYLHDWIPIVIFMAIATTYAAVQLPSLGHRSEGSGSFVGWFLAPVLLVHFIFSIHRYWAWRFGEEPSLGVELVMSAAAMVVPWIVGGFFSTRWWRPWTWLAAIAAGAAGRLAIWSAHHFLTALAHHDPQVFVVLDLPTSLILLFLQITVFIGLASRDMTDEDREWWARAGAWILIVGITWLVATAIVFLGPIALDAAIDSLGLSRRGGRAGLGLVTVMSGGAAYRMIASLTAETKQWQRITSLALVIAAPAIAILLMVLVSDGNRVLLQAIHDLHLFDEHGHPIGASLPEDVIAFLLLLAIGLGLGQVISINQFSLHGMYRNRLVRTFLGTSRTKEERHPSAFTGFDAQDDLPFADVSAMGRPLHVVNATLNLVDENRLAVAERKAASFTFSPLHVGSWQRGYRPSDQYAAGVKLGEALTTSGAAVSSNMGAYASRPLTFLLTVLNARLGVWLGNPGAPGDATWMRASPTFGVAPLVSELLGRTTDRSPYVYLSDGGHFENLGLYEMVMRRCRYIIVSDAGCDGSYAFADLANAVRQIRLDFAIDIEFPDGVLIGPPKSPSRSAIGVIKYSAVDPLIDDGVLVYLKPAITGDEPVDVANYARTHPAFPHESTTEQWFDAAQFESYRMLGLHTVQTLCGGRTFASPRELCLVVSRGAYETT
ncbi:MAG TPA: patatin-like phospholipase family protein [Vicinamibacterales bacterium]|nr:patatin-like phospholipase family protein [Vicinamibacterales bacterium]